jgi:hypothetical protein
MNIHSQKLGLSWLEEKISIWLELWVLRYAAIAANQIKDRRERENDSTYYLMLRGTDLCGMLVRSG